METIKQGILLSIMTFAFWGVLYPQFSLVEESYEIYGTKEKNPRDDFFAILEADKGEIIISSRILEALKARQDKRK